MTAIVKPCTLLLCPCKTKTMHSNFCTFKFRVNLISYTRLFTKLNFLEILFYGTFFTTKISRSAVCIYNMVIQLFTNLHHLNLIYSSPFSFYLLIYQLPVHRDLSCLESSKSSQIHLKKRCICQLQSLTISYQSIESNTDYLHKILQTFKTEKFNWK